MQRPGHSESTFVEGTDHTCRRTRPSQQPSYRCVRPFAESSSPPRPAERHLVDCGVTSEGAASSAIEAGQARGRACRRGCFAGCDRGGPGPFGIDVGCDREGLQPQQARRDREPEGLGGSGCETHSARAGPRPFVCSIEVVDRGAWGVGGSKRVELSCHRGRPGASRVMIVEGLGPAGAKPVTIPQGLDRSEAKWVAIARGRGPGKRVATAIPRGLGGSGVLT
jgi:hypothetical protein